MRLLTSLVALVGCAGKTPGEPDEEPRPDTESPTGPPACEPRVAPEYAPVLGEYSLADLDLRDDGTLTYGVAAHGDYAVGRLQIGGDPDKDYGQGGRVAGENPLTALSITSDGSAFVATTTGTDATVRVTRRAENGDLDVVWGEDGVLALGSDEGLGMIADDQGRLWVRTELSLLRFDASGSADTTFGVDGAVALPPDFATSELVLRDDGVAVVWQRLDEGVALLAYGDDGTLLRRVDRDLGYAEHATSAPDGGVVLLTSVEEEEHVVRFDADLDEAADWIVPQNRTGHFYPRTATVDGQGRVWLGGIRVNADWAGHAAVMRLLSNGELDPCFAADGTTMALDAYAVFAASRVLPDGSAVFAMNDLDFEIVLLAWFVE